MSFEKYIEHEEKWHELEKRLERVDLSAETSSSTDHVTWLAAKPCWTCPPEKRSGCGDEGCEAWQEWDETALALYERFLAETASTQFHHDIAGILPIPSEASE